MKTLLIDVDPQGSRGSDTAGTPQQRTDYYLSYKYACDKILKPVLIT